MTSMELLEILNSARDGYVLDARSEIPVKRVSLRRTLLIAAAITLSLLLVGCAVAYAQGWFTGFFSGRSETPLSDKQRQYIQENEQIVAESQTQNGWTVALNSTMCDGERAYVIFTVTAPEDMDLEYFLTSGTDDQLLLGYIADPTLRPLFLTSEGIFWEEMNAIWAGSAGWAPDNDGKSNTLNYVYRFWCETLDPTKARLVTDPFDSGLEFYFHFENFVHQYQDKEYAAEIGKKYAGQDYMIDGEEAERMYINETLAEGVWDFTLTFHEKSQGNGVELISEPVTVEADVHRKVGDEPLFYDISIELEPVKLTSFRLTPFGAYLTVEQEPDMLGIFFEWQYYYNHEDRYIYAVMKDGSQIALKTTSIGTTLTAEAPIVLEQVDHILMGDGTVLPMPD